MLYRLQRHPLTITAEFGHSLVLTYAVPANRLRALLPPGLELDTYGDLGFLAIALVQTRRLRPRGFPRRLGCDSFLAGYRIFVRFRTPFGHRRGLRILRSLTDRRLMKWGGNLLTHYAYETTCARVEQIGNSLQVEIRRQDREAELRVTADLESGCAPLPRSSPFPDLTHALRFAGPLPWTFDYEPQTHSIIQIKGQRDRWAPRSVHVEVAENAFLARPAFRGAVLASAFHTHGIRYTWLRGMRTPLQGRAT